MPQPASATPSPATQRGFVNVMWLGLAVVLLMLAAFTAVPAFSFLSQLLSSRINHLPSRSLPLVAALTRVRDQVVRWLEGSDLPSARARRRHRRQLSDM